jgi:phytoene desaturase
VPKIIIVGAGVGGLSAAARLARTGHQVEIFESSDRTGGKCQTEWIGDYAFDTGPSLFTLPAVYKDLFLKTGKRFEHELTLTATDPSFRYNFPDGKSVDFVNLDLPKTCAAIDRALGKSAGDAWHHLMQRAEAMWDISRNSFVQSQAPTLRSLLRNRNFLRDLRLIAPWNSLQKLASTYTKDPHLTAIVDRYATYTGSDPRLAPAALLTIPFIETTFGAWHISGGVGQLAQALTRRCLDLGVTIHLNTPVGKILTEDDRAVGVVDGNGVTHKCDKVIVNADPALAYEKLIDPKIKSAAKERRNLLKADKSLAGFVLLLGLDNSKAQALQVDLPKLAHHNIYFPKDYDAEFDQIFQQKVPVDDPTIYICKPDDATMTRRENTEAWFVLINAPRHEPGSGWDWRTGGDQYAQKIVSKLDALGLNVSQRIDVMEFRTPYDLENSTNAPGGSIYGNALHGASSVFKRAKNKSPIQDLYFVGGGAHPGGGLPLVGISAEIVVDDINGTKPGESFH